MKLLSKTEVAQKIRKEGKWMGFIIYSKKLAFGRVMLKTVGELEAILDELEEAGYRGRPKFETVKGEVGLFIQRGT